METNYFYGVDKSIDISILEYGVLVSKEPNDKNEYLIIYGINNDGNSYKSFSSISLSEFAINSMLKESWFDKKSFFNYCGMNEVQWLFHNIANKIRDLIAYYGVENICGISYSTFDEDEMRQYLSDYGNKQ